MKKEYKKPESMRCRYIECICHDMEDLTQLIYEPEQKEFYFQYKLIRCPTTFMMNYCPMRTKKDRIMYHYYKIKNYFKNILYAAIGLPLWYSANPTYKFKEAKKIARFIDDCIAGKKAGEEWGL